MLKQQFVYSKPCGIGTMVYCLALQMGCLKYKWVLETAIGQCRERQRKKNIYILLFFYFKVQDSFIRHILNYTGYNQ